MVFSSLLFLYIFLPVCVAAYFAFPQAKVKNAVLIAASVLFYAWGEPIYVFLLVASAALNYGFGLLLDHFRYNKGAWVIFAACMVFDLAALVFFKYAGFFAESLNTAFGFALPVPKVTLPIGISFYTFQIMSYTTDVYRGKVEKQKSFSRFLLYVSLFPQLIAGPIVRYSEISPQLESRQISLDGIFYGVFRFCVGLGKKVLLANYAGSAASLMLDGDMTGATMTGTWFGILMFAFEIYFDFSGYSDMAIGLGRVFGFKYNENFDLPYTSKSIKEFWRRWHISLGAFFRDYVYIPMGGNRKHQVLNLLVVWSLTGLWHGASWNFLLWGLYFFVLLVAEKKLWTYLQKLPNWLRLTGTFFSILLGWTLFYFTDLTRLIDALKVMFGGGALYSASVGISVLNSLLLLLACIFGCTPLPKLMGLFFSSLCTDGENGRSLVKERIYAAGLFLFELIILFLCTVSLVGSSYNPFLYFRF